VSFKKVNGSYLSAEPQSPLLPMVIKRVKASKQAEGRIVLSHNENEITLYCGHLFAYFLEQNGLTVSGRIRIGNLHPNKDRLILRYLSPSTLSDIIARLLEFSNNYITNQILIAAGVTVFETPGTLEKGVRAARTYAGEILQLKDIHLIEGSGISRANRITAQDMSRVLEAFAPHYTLMRHNGRQYYKSGTLHGISTRAGYIESPSGSLNRFVVLINSKGKSAERITRRIMQALN
jgi:D-alanyl-D-alanine carboxypeptidase/D-alanyl-D-alanine-endopeptidase (penicillin-binding protein 4)